MSRLDELPADQRAALSLLLRQRKTYAEVAGMLGIAERAVHDRAHAALAVLAPREARALDAAARGEIGDYLLGQQDNVGERMRTRTLLASTPTASAWARAIAAELAPLSDQPLPEIPAPGEAPTASGAPVQEPSAVAEAAGKDGDGSSAGSGRPFRPASSRRGGAVLLAVLAVAAIVAVVLIVSGGSSGSKHGSGAKGKSGSASATQPKQEGRIALHAPAGSGSKGNVEILSEGNKRAFYLQAEHLPETKHFFYAVWLYNSPTSALPLSKSPPVGKNHELAGAALLPSNAGSYHEILLTRETSTRPKHPGQVVLRGTFSLSG
jgi:hypothetical protein